MAKKYTSKKARDGSNNAIVILSIVVALSIVLAAVIALSQPKGGSIGGGTAQNQVPNEEVIQSYKTQLQSNPNDVAVRTNLGHAYFEQGIFYYQKNDNRMNEKFNLAAAEYVQALKQNPKDKSVLGNLATCYFYTGRTDDAITEVKKALEVDPNFEPALLNYAIYLGAKNDFTAAIDILKKIPPTAQNYGQAQQLMKDYQSKAPKK